jgi:PAS domain S-box-containing protein
MSDLSEFLSKRLSRRGDRASLARRLQVGEATVTKWAAGKTTPPFDKCFLIAEYCHVNPRDIFRMAGRPDFRDLYDRTFPEFGKSPLREEDLYERDDHCNLHRRVQALLDSGRSSRLALSIRQLEEQCALIESERLFKCVFDQGPLAMTVTAGDYRLLKINQIFRQVLGYSRQELSSAKLTDIIFPEDVKSSIVAVDGLLRGEQSFYQTKRRYLKRDGSSVSMSLTGCAIFDEDGSPRYILEMSRDLVGQARKNKFARAQRSVGTRSRALIDPSRLAGDGIDGEAHDEPSV